MKFIHKYVAVFIGMSIITAVGYTFCFNPTMRECQLDCVVAPALTPDSFPRPFAIDSIWNRPIPSNAKFADITESLFGDPEQVITIFGIDLVTVCESDPNEPLVQIEKSLGWQYPDRACSSGTVLYSRHLADDACIGVSWTRNGNALLVIVDPETGLADENVAAWRCPGEPILVYLGDNPEAHNIDLIDGDGLIGEGRGSGLPAIGGLLRQGELDFGIPHAVAVNMNARRFSEEQHFIWPATQADGYVDDPVMGYHGPDPNYTMGTLLAIPPSVDLAAFAWKTHQGLHLARAAQNYGWYIVDDSFSFDVMQFAVEIRAAINDLGLKIDLETGDHEGDPSKIDSLGFDADMKQILRLLQAVVSNEPNLVIPTTTN